MKTIDERASTKYQPIKFADGTSDKDVILFNIRMEERRVGYVQGATEQKIIDIYKACDWLKRANSALPPCYKMFEVNIKNFRKAMEG